jgi:hemolysin-activating ACP:hemolysin acyltransferase
MIADVLELMLKSDMHRDWYIHDIERLVLPALNNDKMEILYHGTRPTGLFSHAFLPRDVAQGYREGTRKLPSSVWKNGPRDGTMYVIDFIAPYQNALEVARFTQRRLTERYLETYPYDGAYFVRQMKGKRVGYATGVQSELEIRRYACAV